MSFVFGVQNAEAQPQCSANFDPYQSCQWGVHGREYVFLGRVISVSEKTDRAYGAPQKIAVEVETPIKGRLKRRVELFVDRRCYGEIYENRRYIFTARQVKEEKFSGLLSEKWSSEIGDRYSKTDVAEFVREIRSAVKKEKQPRLTGAVVEQAASVKGRYMIASRGIKKEFEPGYLRPLANIEVEAKAADGRVFTTLTDGGGEFVFADLPVGIYELDAGLSKDYDVRAEGLSLFGENGKTLLQIRDGLCTQRVTFNAQRQGQIEVKIRHASKEKNNMVVSLWRVFSNGKNPEILEWFYDAPTLSVAAEDGRGFDLVHTFGNVPVGRYVVMLFVIDSPLWAKGQIFYPGTPDWKKAEVITVETRKTTGVVFRLPE